MNMKTLRPLMTKEISRPTTSPFVIEASKSRAYVRGLYFRIPRPSCVCLHVSRTDPASASSESASAIRAHATSPALTASEIRSDSAVLQDSPTQPEWWEAQIEKVIYGCRFMTFLGVMGSLIGSLLCFVKGCTYIAQAFMDYAVNRTKVIFVLVEAVDVYLLGTVMLVFGMGLYELFVSNLDIAKSQSSEKSPGLSSLFGLFTLKERPKWLEIKSVNELKTKLGHVIVMLLLIGLFEKSKKAAIHSPLDLLCFSASVLFSSGCLYLLSKLGESK